MAVEKFKFALDRFTNFGDLLKYLRRRVGLTQRELALAVGYSYAQISRLEQNQRAPDPALVAARFLPALELEDEPDVAARLVDLAGLAPVSVSPASGTVPFKGLQYFDEADSGLFFGREELTRELVQRIMSLVSSDKLHFLAVVGASGSGKSSLARAGLIPALRDRGPFRKGLIRCITPTAHPLESLSTAEIFEETSDIVQPRREKISLSEPAQNHRLLVVDQFEEVFTLCQDEVERQAFVSQLLMAASKSGGAIFVVVVLRADFYARCARYPALRDALASSQVYIGPMSAENLRRAIEEPAKRCEWELEPGLIEILLKDLGADDGQNPEPGSLPLLSHALLETWNRRRARTLTVSGYLASGGVLGAIAETADAMYYDEFEPSQRDIARKIFLRLIQIGDEEGGIETRRQAALTEFIHSSADESLVQDVLNRLADARLVITSHGSVDLAHEALIRSWPALRSWLDADRESLLLHRRLTLSAEGWERQKRDAGELYRGARLSQAQSWAGDHPDELNPLEQEFLATSSRQAAEEEAERETHRQRELKIARELVETQRNSAVQLRRRARFLTAAVTIALLLAVTALFLGEIARRNTVTAQNQSRIAYARELAAASVSNLGIDPERSILLALQSVSTTQGFDGSVLPESEEALHRSILGSQVRLTLTGHQDWVLTTAFSPDGKRLASIERDGNTILWDAASGKPILQLKGLTAPGDANGYQRLAFSPDGKWLITGDAKLVRAWDTNTGNLVRELSGHTGEVWAVAYSPDGQFIASSGADATVRVWDASSGEPLHVMEGHQSAVESLAFRPGTTQLATASDDQSVRIWDYQASRLIAERDDFTSEVYAVAFSPDGKFLAIGNGQGINIWEADKIQEAPVLVIPVDSNFLAFSPDGNRLASITGSVAKLWDAHTGREIFTLAGHSGWLGSLAFSPDGKRMATSSYDKTVKIWSLAPGIEQTTLDGKWFRPIYSPDGSRIAATDDKGTVLIADAGTGIPIVQFGGHSPPILSLAFRPDGRRLVTGGFDQTAKVWDTATGQLLLTLSGHSLAVRHVAYSPDGKWIATASFDQTAKLWNAETGQEVRTLTGHTGLVLGVTFSPDSSRIATSSTDRTTKIWETATGNLLFTLADHLDPIPDIVFSPDGQHLVSGSQDGTAKIWDAHTGKELLTLTGHTSAIMSVAFSANGKYLATGSGDQSVIVWDAATGKELHTLPENLDGVTGVAFNPRDSNRLVVGSVDGTVRVFLLGIDDLISLAHSRVTRSLLPWECQKYLHREQCPT